MASLPFIQFRYLKAALLLLIFTFQRSHSLKSKRINDYFFLIFFFRFFGLDFLLLGFCCCCCFGVFFCFVCKGRLFYLPIQSLGIDV